MTITILGVFLPLLLSVTTGFFGRYLGFRGVFYLILSGLFLVVGINSYTCFITCYYNDFFFINLGNYITISLLVIDWLFLFDSLTGLTLFTVSLVSFCVHIFSCSYMRDDPHFIRFMSYLCLFTFFMLFMVSSGNLFLFFWG